MKTRNTMRLYFSIISCVLFLFLGCKDTSSTINPDDTTVNDSTFTDIRDNRKYTIIKIDTQIWMSENLQTSTYRNGNPIRYARTKQEWLDAEKVEEGAWCYSDHDEQNGKTYGKLYNWYAVNDSRGLAPKGFLVPSDWEWFVLTNYLGGKQIAGFKMKSTTGWVNNGNGDNSSGFNGLPAGFYECFDPISIVGKYGCWWSSTETCPIPSKPNLCDGAWFYFLGYSPYGVERESNPEYVGMSVRCLKD